MRLARALNHAGLAGIRFIPVEFTPGSSKFANEKCSGFQLVVTDRRALSPLRAGITIAYWLRRLHPDDWQTEALLRLLGNQRTVDELLEGTSPDRMEDHWQAGLAGFEQRRRGFLLYD